MSRNKNRIPICLKLLFVNKTLYDFLGTNAPGWAKKLHENWELIEKEWYKSPDQRFGQLLSNMGLVSKEIEDKIAILRAASRPPTSAVGSASAYPFICASSRTVL